MSLKYRIIPRGKKDNTGKDSGPVKLIIPDNKQMIKGKLQPYVFHCDSLKTAREELPFLKKQITIRKVEIHAIDGGIIETHTKQANGKWLKKEADKVF